jgi:tetratricopeptide (TPR) repeat protein
MGDLKDLAEVDAALLKQGDWRLLRSAEGARYLSWSEDGGALGWIDSGNGNLRVWMFGGEPTARPILGTAGTNVADYLTLNRNGTQAMVGVHAFSYTPQILDHLEHRLYAIGGPQRMAARSTPSPLLKHSGAVFAGDRLLLLETLLAEAPDLGPWAMPRELKALWFSPGFDRSAINLDLRGVDYTLLDLTPTRALTPTWAPLARKVFLGMGVTQDGENTRPRLVVRGLKLNGSYPGAFAELGQSGNYEFDVPGAPLSLTAAPNGAFFVYTHGPVGAFQDSGFGPSYRLAEDGHFATSSKGIWFLRPGRDPVFVPQPFNKPCYEVAWRPGGLEIAVATDLDEDGRLDVCLYDLTDQLRNMQRRRSLLEDVQAEEDARQAAVTKAREEKAQHTAARKARLVAKERKRAARKQQAATILAQRAKVIQRQKLLEARKNKEETYQRSLQAAQKSLKSGHFLEASAAAQEAAEARPEALEPLHVQALAALRQRQFGEAEKNFRALFQHPDLPENRKPQMEAQALLAAGRAKLERSQVGPGLASLARSISKWPAKENPAYAQLIGECLDRKLYSDGLRFVDRWIKSGAGEKARRLKVRLHSGTGDHEQAIAMAQALVQEHSFSAPEKVALGNAYLAAGKAEKALRLFREARTLAPDFPGIEGHIFEAESRKVLGKEK